MHAPLRGIWAGYGVDLGMDILAAQGASFQPGGQLGGGQVPRRPLFFFFHASISKCSGDDFCFSSCLFIPAAWFRLKSFLHRQVNLLSGLCLQQPISTSDGMTLDSQCQVPFFHITQANGNFVHLSRAPRRDDTRRKTHGLESAPRQAQGQVVGSQL